MADERNNKNSGTEDELGYIHKGITRVLTHVVDKMIADIEEEGIDVALCVDFRQLESMQKWVVDRNKITTAAPEADIENELNTKITEVKNRQALRLAANGGSVVYDDEE